MKLIPFDYAVRNLGRAPRRSLAILMGNILVILLVISASSFVEGMRSSLSLRNTSDNIIIMATGSEESIERSEISATIPGILSASLPGIREVNGVSFVSPEILSGLIFHEDENSEEEMRAIVRGITSGAFLVHERVEIVEGRAPVAGNNELAAGGLATDKLGLPADRLDIGQSLWFEGESWTVVGKFKARGTVMDAELWTPLTDLQVATKRDGLSCVVVQLDGAEFADVDAFTKMRVDLELSAVPEARYYASLLKFYRPIQIMIWISAIIVSLAGILGGLNTLYSAFSARVRELGMLQSLGFSRRAIVLNLIQESVLVASLAVFISILLAQCFLDGISVSFSLGVFQLVVNSTVITTASTVGITLGIIGALPPAWRCLRMPIPESLKSL